MEQVTSVPCTASDVVGCSSLIHRRSQCSVGCDSRDGQSLADGEVEQQYDYEKFSNEQAGL